MSSTPSILDPRRLGLLLGVIACCTSPACAVHRVGMVESSGAGVALVSPDGRSERLLLTGPSDALQHLTEHMVEVDGAKRFGSIQVRSFRALEGPHGLPVFMGPVQRLGIQIGIADPSTGELLVVDDASAKKLQQWLGARVAAEGYVDGPLHLQVLYWVLLDPPKGDRPGGVDRPEPTQ